MYRKFELEYSENFFPKSIYEWCKFNYKNYYDININSHTKLSVALTSNSISSSSPLYGDILEFIKIIKSFKLFFKKNYKLHIFYLPTSFKKKWNKKDKLSSININSGFTSSNFCENDQSSITIFRKEESFKVLIHELLHIYILRCKNKLYNPLVDESIIEAWATILNCHRILSNSEELFIPKNEITYNNIFKSKIFKDEQNFSIQQTHKLLTSNLELYSNSAAFFYYIIKSSILCNPKTFIKQYFLTEIINKCIKFNVSDYLDNNEFINKLTNVIKLNNSSMKMTLYGDYITKKNTGKSL